MSVLNCLITGSAKRIGREIALTLAKEGHNICIHYNKSYNEAISFQEELKKYPINSSTVKAELEDEKETSSLIANASAKIGNINLLINNASIFENDHITEITKQSFDKHINTNLYAPLILSKQMAKNINGNDTGHIINILDQRIWRLTPNFISYTLSKSALWTATQTLSQALAPNIRVNAIAPGPTIKNHRQSEADFKDQIENIPLQKQVNPQEIANTVIYLVNNPSITGQYIAIDGGQSLSWMTPDFLKSKE